MTQNLNLSVSGLNSSISDYNGLPPGALTVADNVESRYKNVLEPRRGFELLPDSEMLAAHQIRLTNFYLLGADRVIGINNLGQLNYYSGVNPWLAVPGVLNVVTHITPPDETDAKSRFIHAGQNLYVTSQDGIRSLSSGIDAQFIRAGVPKGLNLEAVTNGDAAGFFNNNVILRTTGDTTIGDEDVTDLDSTVGIIEGQFVSGASIAAGTKVLSVAPEVIILVENATLTAPTADLTNLAVIGAVVAGDLVTGKGIPAGAKVVSTSGVGPYAVVIDSPVNQSGTAVPVTFSKPLSIKLTQNATATAGDTNLVFYSGAQVAYRLVFGRVETDINNNTITRLGAASSVAIALNTSATSTNVTVTGAIPTNSEHTITFVQLYRSFQTDLISVSAIDQYKLVEERRLTPAEFLAGIITFEDEMTTEFMGIPLYSGSDQEGILQSNEPPPMAWDMCKFRDFALYGNITRPSTLRVSLTSVGAPEGVQVGDTITIAGTFQGTPYTKTYTASLVEDLVAGNFEVVSTGTPSQNIADTADSLIRVINYDVTLPVHAILLSTSTDLSGQILFEADNPSYEPFMITASLHADAYDPTLTDVFSKVNTIRNGIAVSKTQELEAVPLTNIIYAGDSSSPILRLIPLRDYVIVIKTDGIYKVLGTHPGGLVCNPFDLTTRIIGADTAVSLNSAVWMLSDEGIVSISDGGVESKSIPIDDKLNELLGSFHDNINKNAFAIGYDADRKYILCLPKSVNEYAELEYNFNYVTNSFTTWSRNLYTSFIHSIDNKIYISRSDVTNKGVSKERKNGNYRDFVDEAIPNEIVAIDPLDIRFIELDNVDLVEVGDVLYQDETHFSPIITLDALTNIVTTQSSLTFALGDVEILKSYRCTITWKQVFGDNPAFVRQFSEGLALFKNTRFNEARLRFVTDFSSSTSTVMLDGRGVGAWGMFPWGLAPWGSSITPSSIRFYIPQDKQLGSYLIPSFSIKQGHSEFKMQGLSISYYNISQEVGK